MSKDPLAGDDMSIGGSIDKSPGEISLKSTELAFHGGIPIGSHSAAHTEEGMGEILATKDADEVVDSAYHGFGLWILARAHVTIECCGGGGGDTDTGTLGTMEICEEEMPFYDVGWEGLDTYGLARQW